MNKETLWNYNKKFKKEVIQEEKKYKVDKKVWLKINKEMIQGIERFLKKTYEGPYIIIKLRPH